MPPSATDSVHACGIALGSNLGDRLGNLRQGLALLLQRLPEAKLTAVAPLYETAPVDCAGDSPPFYNSVVEIETPLPPLPLRKLTAAIERELGRPNQRLRNAPRPLDLDLLYYGDLILTEETLTLPHPRLTRRRFVLQPLADIRPGLLLPGQNQTVAELLAALPAENEVVVMAKEWFHHPPSCHKARISAGP